MAEAPTSIPGPASITADALLFDMDGVLLDSRPVVERTWRRWAARHGVDAEPLLRIAHGRRTRDTLRAAVPALATEEEVAWLDAAELEDFEGIAEIAGASALVAAIPAGRWTIVTSAGRELARRRLAMVGIVLPEHAITSEDVRRGKPAPDGYLEGARRLSVDAARCIVLEDTPPGIEAGVSAGARVIAVTTTHAPRALSGASFVVHDLRPVRILETAPALVITISALAVRSTEPND